ncbi:MarR family transcriptional regulator [Dyella soli]|nr:MarR family transcriptional regulator [Dyella soli]
MSAQGVLLSAAVAERVGLSSSDLECLDFIVMAGPEAMTPGQLVVATGLTSGAVTGLIDRLERSGFVRREADPVDRRKVRVVAVEARVRPIFAYYERLAQRTQALWAQFTEEQLRMVLDFTRRSIELSAEEATHIRTLPPLKHVAKSARKANS